jgi:hypothetical protein
MNQFLKQSTAVTIPFGPFLDDTDGKTAETALVIQKADVRVSKNGGAFAAANADQGASDAGAPHMEAGEYGIALNATDTNTLGRIRVRVSKTGALPVWINFMVVPANVYESLVNGSEWLEVTAMANRIARSGTDMIVYKQDDTTEQFRNVGAFTAAGSSDVLTSLNGKT